MLVALSNVKPEFWLGLATFIIAAARLPSKYWTDARMCERKVEGLLTRL